MSVYVWHSEGLSGRNREVIAEVLRVARLHGGPWVAGGDFNMDPEKIRDFPGLDAGGVTMVAPPKPPVTCTSRVGPVAIDYLWQVSVGPDI